MAHSKVDGKNKDESNEMEVDNNQHVSKTESDSDGEYHEPGMRVGHEYQAIIPQLVSDNKEDAKHDPNLKHNALLVWSPVDEIPNAKLDDYVHVAKDKHGYNVEQALGMLLWHKHNLERSLMDLANFTPFPDEWSMEDKILFEQAYSSHGKSFKRIQQTLPDKSVATLVKYYYSWKKTRSRTSLIDRQAKKMAVQKEPVNDPESDNSDSSDSDFEPEKEQTRQTNGQSKPKLINKQPTVQGSQPTVNLSGPCGNCHTQSSQLHATQKGNMCSACYQFLRRTGTLRPRHEGRETRTGHRGSKVKRKAPKGMVLSQEYLVAVSGTHGDTHVRPLEMEIVNLKRQIQMNKQSISQNKYQLDSGIEVFRQGDQNNKNNARWSNEELLLAVQSVRRYGKDFQAMAEVLGNKSVSQCRNFFVNYKRRFNLQQVLEEYEAEQGITSSDRKDDDLQVLHMSGSPAGSSGNSSPSQPDRSSPSFPSQGMPGQPPPLLKPSGSQSQQRHPPPLQPQGGVPRANQSGLQGPPPLIKPLVRPIQPQPLRPQVNPMMRQSPPSHLIHQMMDQKSPGVPIGRSESPHSASGTSPLRQTRSGM